MGQILTVTEPSDRDVVAHHVLVAENTHNNCSVVLGLLFQAAVHLRSPAEYCKPPTCRPGSPPREPGRNGALHVGRNPPLQAFPLLLLMGLSETLGQVPDAGEGPLLHSSDPTRVHVSEADPLVAICAELSTAARTCHLPSSGDPGAFSSRNNGPLRLFKEL